MGGILLTEITYVLTEEIVRRVLEVVFKKTEARDKFEWFECFSNPTAGPWKKINFPIQKGIVEVSRYEKEEKRPDLILYSNKHEIFFVIEAKTEFYCIVNDNTMKKCLETFKKEHDKIRDIAKRMIQNSSDFEIICGFVYYSEPGNIANELVELHDSFNRNKSDIKEFNCDEHVEFIVFQGTDGLHVCWNCNSERLREKLEMILPKEIIPFKNRGNQSPF